MLKFIKKLLKFILILAIIAAVIGSAIGIGVYYWEKNEDKKEQIFNQKVKEKAGDASSRGTALECFQYAEQQRVQREQLEHFLKKSRLNG